MIAASFTASATLGAPLGVVDFDWASLADETGLQLAIMGMSVVFTALILVVTFIKILPRVIDRLERHLPTGHGHGHGHGAPAAAPPSPARPSEGVPPHVMVVIAAAVAETVSEPHRILHTQPLTSADMAWSAEGRRQHHISHRTRGRW